MNALLNETEVRVVGSLIEKEVTTPDYYPLSLNALVNACNQTSNRHPVVSYDEKTVARALESLRDKGLARVVHGSDSRVPKYRQMFTEHFRLSPSETAAMCVLMLRGPQTVGEIRGRSGRLYNFEELADVEETLQKLASRDQPLVVLLPRQVGQKESRYAHLLSGEVQIEEQAFEVRPEAATREVRTENERVAKLEQEVESLRSELTELQRQFQEFRKQFD